MCIEKRVVNREEGLLGQPGQFALSPGLSVAACVQGKVQERCVVA